MRVHRGIKGGAAAAAVVQYISSGVHSGVNEGAAAAGLVQVCVCTQTCCIKQLAAAELANLSVAYPQRYLGLRLITLLDLQRSP